MSTIQWKRGIALPQDADAIRDYTFDFTQWLESETIASATVSASNCTAAITASTTTTVKVRVSAVGNQASITVTPTTNGGQKDDFSINFNLVQN